MRRDPLRLLLRLRQQAVEEARRALAASLKAEAEAAAARDGILQQAARDRGHEATLAGLSPSLLTAATLGSDRLAHRQRQAQVMVQRAGQETAVRRERVVAERTQAEAVAALLAEREAKTSRYAEKKLAHALDDMARARFQQCRKAAHETNK